MATLIVGSLQAYTTISAAVAAAKPGDMILVQAGTYTNDFPASINGLTIEGVGGKVNLVATKQPPNGKAIFDVSGNTVLKNLTFSGATVPDGNGAGVRYEGGNLTVQSCVFHDNQNGLLGGVDPNGTITIDHSEFYNNGTSAGNTHNIYIGDIKQFTLTNSYVHDANVGHEVKSRAENNTITGNRIYDNSGTSSYSIDLPNGGNAVIANNTIEQGANGQNGVILAYGEEGSLHAGTNVSLTGNTIVNDMKAHPATLLWDAPGTALKASGNTLYGLTASQLGGLSGAGFKYATTRPALSTSSPIQPAPDLVTFKLTADAIGGKVGFIASVDGKILGGTQYVTAKSGTAAETVSFTGAWGSGSHHIAITEINAQSEGVAAHTLQVQGITYDGKSLLASTVQLGSFATARIGTAQPGAAQLVKPPTPSSWLAADTYALADTAQVVPAMIGKT